MLRDKRIVLTIVLLLYVGISFWAGSRVPALNEKALMGGETELDALGFETRVEVRDTDPLLKRVLFTTINWVETNRKGMTFGVIFGSILMVLISLIKKKSSRNAFGNSVLGMTIGAPLGVCVNCAAPIAQGLHSGGARVETVVAAMVSSPTLNIIVLTMLFSLFPPYMVAIKLVLTFTFILVAIPLVSRWLYPNQTLSDAESAAMVADAKCELPGVDEIPESWFSAARWVIVAALRSFWYVLRTTVPLMFVAGFLGSLVITVLPWDTLADLVPNRGPIFALASMAAVALVGLTLPVPISFDVLVPAILMSAGMPVTYAMILLFTLGIFSIYPFFIIWNSIGKKMALVLTGILVVAGITSGVVGENMFQRKAEDQRQLFFSTFGKGANAGPGLLTLDTPAPAPDVAEPPARPSQLGTPTAIGSGPYSVRRMPFIQADAPTGSFTRHLGREVGIDDHAGFAVDSFIALKRFRSVAAGDVDGDGLLDLVFATNGKVSLYENLGGMQFAARPLDVDGLEDLDVMLAALVDVDNDRALDLFLTTDRAGNYVVLSRNGDFTGQSLESVPNDPAAILTAALSFGDPDRDGDLDVASGNFTIGSWGRNWTSAPSSYLERVDKGYEMRPMGGVPGEAQAALFTDIDGDGLIDLFMGNDFKAPDYFFMNDGNGGFRELTAADGIVPHTTWSTMTIASADIDNDLRTDMYVGQITGFKGTSGLERYETNPKVCRELGDGPEREHCERSLEILRRILRGRSTKDPFRCLGVEKEYQEDCLAVLLLSSAAQWSEDQEMCDLFPEEWERFGLVCDGTFTKANKPSAEVLESMIAQVRQRNVLLKAQADGTFVDVAEDMGVDTVGWTWASKLADIDNDEWQDLYVVNGEFYTSLRESNMCFLNQSGEVFQDRTEDLGLKSFLATTSFVYADLDNDGDLDIVTPPVLGPVSVYENEVGSHNAIAFQLRDAVGNSHGIGSKVTIHYGDGGERHQMRELQIGGGFASFDPAVVHFGLGEHDSVERVDVAWSTGERSEFAGPFTAGACYLVERSGSVAGRTE